MSLFDKLAESINEIVNNSFQSNDDFNQEEWAPLRHRYAFKPCLCAEEHISANNSSVNRHMCSVAFLVWFLFLRTYS